MPNGKPMTKAQLVAHFAEKFGLSKAQTSEFFAELARVAAKEAEHGFILPDIGKLVMVKRNARMGRNPKTGEAIQIPAKTVLKFKIAKACKDAVLGEKM
ncbi:MAG: HU family DNA-binding protein [candidate division KSB1 bacterium]|nr:HU family DNA-binding protein [candidate division KSB1 bacterium]MDZ7302329.1 HU family DNA-binding protein [candidate division KSB1 bacterium]MDZ7311182.1 HU family DNA-binding protein [candidate division KSB1 bacterium]